MLDQNRQKNGLSFNERKEYHSQKKGIYSKDRKDKWDNRIYPPGLFLEIFK